MVDVLGSCKQQGLFMVDKCGNHLLSSLDSLPSRADLLMARFSDTIFKAELWHHTKDEKNEAARKEKEKKLMEKMRVEQQAKNRAAAVIAARKSREEKLQRQRDRTAARRALEELEKNVVVDDWHQTYKDFLMLIDSK